MFTKREVIHILISILVLSFIFGFDDGQTTFRFGYWLQNMFVVAVSVAIVILVHDLAHKLVAAKFGSKTRFRIWGIKHYGFARKAHFPIKIHFLNLKVIPIAQFPLGVVLGLILSFVSRGSLFLPLIETFDTETKEYTRVGKQRLKLKEWEDAVIALAGPLANVALIIILRVISTGGIFNNIILISSLYAIFHMLPVSSLDGGKIFLSSPTLWIFGVILILLSILLVVVFNIFPYVFLLILTVLSALIISGFFFFYHVAT